MAVQRFRPGIHPCHLVRHLESLGIGRSRRRRSPEDQNGEERQDHELNQQESKEHIRLSFAIKRIRRRSIELVGFCAASTTFPLSFLLNVSEL